MHDSVEPKAWSHFFQQFRAEIMPEILSERILVDRQQASVEVDFLDEVWAGAGVRRFLRKELDRVIQANEVGEWLLRLTGVDDVEVDAILGAIRQRKAEHAE